MPQEENQNILCLLVHKGGGWLQWFHTIIDFWTCILRDNVACLCCITGWQWSGLLRIILSRGTNYLLCQRGGKKWSRGGWWERKGRTEVKKKQNRAGEGCLQPEIFFFGGGAGLVNFPIQSWGLPTGTVSAAKSNGKLNTLLSLSLQ